jgi:hypothetical protein
MDAEQFKKGLRDAEAAARRSGQQIANNFTGQATKDIKAGEAAFRQFGVGMMAAAGAAAFGLYKTTQAASDLNEQVSQAGVVFKDAKGDIAEFAKSADAIGLSERAATQAANSFGIMFTKMGKGTEEAAAMAVEFTKLAADLASFYNTSVDEAATALRSGLSGEMEPLKRYSIFLDDATLKQRAFDMGLVETTKGTLPPLIKMQAAQAEALEQGNVAMGDAIRTSDGLAGRQRQLTADWENAQAALGEGLTPMLADAANGLSNMLEKASELNAATGGNAGVIAGYGTVILGVAGAASFAIGSIRGMTENFGAAKTAMANWTAGYPRVQAMGASFGSMATKGLAAAAAILAVHEAGKAFYSASFGSEATVDRLTDSLRRLGTDAGPAMGAVAEDAAALGTALQIMQDNHDELTGGNEWNSLPELLGMGSGAQAEVDKWDDTLSRIAREDAPAAKAALDRLSGAFRDAGINQATIDLAFNDTLGVLGDVSEGTAGAAGSTEELGDATAEAAKEQFDFSKALEESRKNLEDLLGVQSAALGIQMDYEASIDSTAEAFKENGLTLDTGTEKGRANVQAIQAQTEAIFANGLAVLDNTGNMDAANATIQAQVDQLRKQMEAAGFSKKKIEELISTLGLMPGDVTTKFIESGYDEVRWKFLELGRLLRESKFGATFDLLGGWGNNTADRPDLRRPPGLAVGGPAYAGVSYIVGETGPELVTMGANGHVSNSSKTSAMLNERGMGGGTEVIQISLDGRVLAEYLREYDRGRR